MPVEDFHFGCPPKKVTSKKEKGPLLIFKLFSFLHFQFSIYHFTIFLLFFSNFSPFSTFFLASFFPVGQQKFPGQKSRGGGVLCPCPYPPPPPPPVTPLPKKTILSPAFFNYFHTMYIYIHLSQPYSSKNKQTKTKKQKQKQTNKQKTKQNKANIKMLYRFKMAAK